MNNMSYIKYEIMGLSNLNLKEDSKYKINNDIIDSILITKELDGITLYLKENKLNKIIEKKCLDFVEEYLLKLCIHPYIEVDNPSYKLSVTYIINKDENKTLNLIETLNIKENIKIIRICDKESFYNEIINTDKINLNQEATIEYKKLMSILKNSNEVTKYLLLYDQLMDLTSKNKKRKEQRNVSDFIRKCQSEFSDFNIEFYKTRRKNLKFKEDGYTYYRNEISHAEFGNDYEKYERLTDNLTNDFINGIIEVINYAIKEAYS